MIQLIFYRRILRFQYGRVRDDHGSRAFARAERLQVNETDAAGANQTDAEDAIVGELHVAADAAWTYVAMQM